MFYLGLYRENLKKIFLPETTRPRALIFGMYHHLVDLHLVCSNYIPGAKNRECVKKIFLSETTRHRSLIFGL